MFISVILAVYNEDQYLEKCLTSLMQQIDVEYEVIVVDDGSKRPVGATGQSTKYQVPSTKVKTEKAQGTRNLELEDEMENIAEKKRELNPIVSLYRIEHGGPAKARNFGVEKAKGEIVVFVDGDMEFATDFLSDLIVPILKSEAQGTFSTNEDVANWDNIWARCWNYENGLLTSSRVNPFRTDMQRDFRAILKSEFTRVGGFDSTGYTDTWTLAQKLGYGPQTTEAHYYHYNPASLAEAFKQSQWIGARERKGGLLGKLISLVRVTFPFSIWNGLKITYLTGEVQYMVFKLIYDLGTGLGILRGMFKGKYL